MQPPLLRSDLKPDDLPVIYKGAFDRELDTIILKQATDPGRPERHRATNLHYARHLNLRATEPRLLDRSLDSDTELQERGLSATDADALSILSDYALAPSETALMRPEKVGAKDAGMAAFPCKRMERPVDPQGQYSLG